MTINHIIPVNDLFMHEILGYNCECKPKIECDGDSVIVIHNAWDGREIIEELEGSND